MGVVSPFLQQAFCPGTSGGKNHMLSYTDGVAGELQSFVFRDHQTLLGGDSGSQYLSTIQIEGGGEIQQLAAA